MSITWVSQGHDMGKQMDLELKGCCNVLNEFGLFGCMLQVSQVPDPTYRYTLIMDNSSTRHSLGCLTSHHIMTPTHWIITLYHSPQNKVFFEGQKANCL